MWQFVNSYLFDTKIVIINRKFFHLSSSDCVRMRFILISSFYNPSRYSESVAPLVKVKNSPYRPLGLRKIEDPRFQDNWDLKVVRLSVLRNGRLYAPSLRRASWHSAAGTVMSMKNSSDAIGNRTSDFPAFTALLQPTAPPWASVNMEGLNKCESFLWPEYSHLVNR